ncbi:hypothetical protein BDD12DRAFT_914716 [Trichophaea hybrida]|nr:hypothetical protein BDD12DRAFT_914716 [Trichophaea hybrida]
MPSLWSKDGTDGLGAAPSVLGNSRTAHRPRPSDGTVDITALTGGTRGSPSGFKRSNKVAVILVRYASRIAWRITAASRVSAATDLGEGSKEIAYFRETGRRRYGGDGVERFLSYNVLVRETMASSSNTCRVSTNELDSSYIGQVARPRSRDLSQPASILQRRNDNAGIGILLNFRFSEVPPQVLS